MTQEDPLFEPAAEAGDRLEPATGPAPASPEGRRASAPDATLLEARLRSEYAEVSGIAAQAARLGVALDAGEAIAKGLKPDALRRAVLEELAARSDALDLVAAAAPAASAPAESPIVRRARERAQAR